MNPRRKSRLSIIILVLAGVVIATTLVLYALRQNIDLFYTPSEVVYGKEDKADLKPEVGQRIRAGSIPRRTRHCGTRRVKRTDIIGSHRSVGKT